MHMLQLTSLQAQSADSYCRAVAGYLSRRLGAEIQFFDAADWRRRRGALDKGEIVVAWLCGLHYVQRLPDQDAPIELLAAPVYRAARYAQRPIYFSDVVVRAGSPFRHFSDLRGARWAFNEPDSQSGFHVVRHYLAATGRDWGFFGQIVASDGHTNSLRLILDGKIDATAVDSTVLESELQYAPALRDAFRIIEVLGPSPVPPWIVSQRLPQSLRHEIRQALLAAHEDDTAGAALRQDGVLHFTAVSDIEYDPIRQMMQQADAAGLERGEAFWRLPNVAAEGFKKAPP